MHVRSPSGARWDRPEREKTSRYHEFGSRGSGANAAGRVLWAKPLQPRDARAISVKTVLGGSDRWDPRATP